LGLPKLHAGILDVDREPEALTSTLDQVVLPITSLDRRHDLKAKLRYGRGVGAKEENLGEPSRNEIRKPVVPPLS